MSDPDPFRFPDSLSNYEKLRIKNCYLGRVSYVLGDCANETRPVAPFVEDRIRGCRLDDADAVEYITPIRTQARAWQIWETPVVVVESSKKSFVVIQERALIPLWEYQFNLPEEKRMGALAKALGEAAGKGTYFLETDHKVSPAVFPFQIKRTPTKEDKNVYKDMDFEEPKFLEDWICQGEIDPTHAIHAVAEICLWLAIPLPCDGRT